MENTTSKRSLLTICLHGAEPGESSGEQAARAAVRTTPVWGLPRLSWAKAGRRVVASVSAHALPAFVLLVLLALLAAPVGSDDRSDVKILQERVTFLELRGAEMARAGEALASRVAELETRAYELTVTTETNTHNNLHQEAKLCDSAVALNDNLGAAFNNGRLLDMAQEQKTLCRRMYERAATYRATRPFIRMTDTVE